jgi:hypothetical protein
VVTIGPTDDLAVVLQSGRVAGVWEQKRRGSQVEVRVEPFEALSGTVRAEVGTEAEALARYLGGALELVIA